MDLTGIDKKKLLDAIGDIYCDISDSVRENADEEQIICDDCDQGYGGGEAKPNTNCFWYHFCKFGNRLSKEVKGKK